jgi:hypothetical protein
VVEELSKTLDDWKQTLPDGPKEENFSKMRQNPNRKNDN